MFAVVGVARQRGLAYVKRLGADFTGMVDPHQAGGVVTLGVCQFVLGEVLGR